jgi:hypothetical protein
MSRPKCKRCNDRGVIVRHIPGLGLGLSPSASLCECILKRLERLEPRYALPTLEELRDRVERLELAQDRQDEAEAARRMT